MFKPTKIGLLNFWLYDEEEFSFFDGKLLLRGENGSGKSVTMQSFIPLILDGNKSPKRLDTFGSNDKHIEYYLLGENNEKEDSTGYLYMEFYNEEKEEYITIGMGLRARVGKNTDFFGFALKDGKRVNHDFFLYKCQDGIHKTPLTKLELKASLGTQNIFVETTKEYKKMVNDLLFQFPNIESFDEFIQVLIQLRSPKLSKEFKPTKLMSVLNEVLPPLLDSDLRPLSDTIENLNQTREKMEELQNKIKTISNFVKVFQNYNETILFQKASSYLQQVYEREQLENSLKLHEEKIEVSRRQLEELRNEERNLNDGYTKAQIEKEQLGNQDIEEKTTRKLVLEKQIAEYQNRIEQEENNLDQLKQKLAQIKSSFQSIEKEIYDLTCESKEDLSTILELGNELFLTTFLEMFQQNNKNFEYFYTQIQEKRNEILIILDLLQKKQRVLEEQDKLSEEFDKLKIQYEKIEQEKEDTYIALEQEMEYFFQMLRNLLKTNQYLPIEEEDYREMVGYLEEYTKENYQKSLLKYESIYQNEYNKTTMEYASMKSQQEEFFKELSIEQEKLNTLKNQEEISFKETELQEDTVEFLKNENIPYLSFYQAVEFQDDLPLETANKIEETLYSSGIINAKILKEEDVSKIQNKNISYLIPATKKKENLTKYLKPSPNKFFSTSYIMSILETISISDQEPLWINEEEFQFDFFKGHISKKYESKYIGALLRKKQQEQAIRQQEQVVRECNERLADIETQVKNKERKIQGLIEEKELFPKNETLEKVYSKITSLELELHFFYEKEGEVEAKIRDCQKEVETILVELENYRNEIPFRIESYQEALENITSLQENLKHFEIILDKISTKEEILNSQKEREEDIVSNYDNTYALIADYLEKKKKEEIELETINNLLNTKEVQELTQKLNHLLKIINDYPEKTKKLSKDIGVLEQSILQEENNINEYKLQIEESYLYEEMLQSIFKEELKLEYVYKDLEISVQTAKKIVTDLKEQNRDLLTANANYYRAFNEYRQDLLDYGISDVPLFNERDSLLDSYLKKGLEEEKSRQILEKAKRQDIVTSYQGKKLSLYALQDALKESYEADKIYLDEQDRHLFEDILLRTIGGKIKERIIDAQEWVKKINLIMAEKQKDSALSFYLDWKPKNQETLEEMNTKELVEIFMLDEGQVRPRDSDKLVKHFRSKIKRAEEFMDERQDSYFEMIFGILDYRSWFTFKLYYRKNQSEKKELTDKIFSVFSGGEKAKTMYVPLFASVYAKLDSASKNAPRLIALDEAFAGVDEKNIEEMFAILESFQLDYILTSQALWCDYKEIKDISICELIKARNASSVAIRRYRWNGVVREVLS